MKVYVTHATNDGVSIWDNVNVLIEYLGSIGNLGVGGALTITVEEWTKEQFDSLEEHDEDSDS